MLSVFQNYFSKYKYQAGQYVAVGIFVNLTIFETSAFTKFNELLFLKLCCMMILKSFYKIWRRKRWLIMEGFGEAPENHLILVFPQVFFI